MTEPLRIVMAMLSVYRVSQLFTIDDGPYALFRRFRMWIGMKAARKDITEGWDVWRNLAELFECPYCMGMWVALLALPLLLWPGIVGDAALLYLGVTGGQTFLESFNAKVRD